ncbi:hypothetical protein DFQ01_112147 [Paenibacillus cellulosilyticus]|uniref:Uncharacterized protein n=1 Tax=Paenibacillus cellulosilyticus TaxID=375489 RepID=A0A2V2YS13_9BACL|nr:hypothetical protein [Paenibacillus cellulosilyticus]PWW00794.1 hypothetical protein DFQ01_112147 [Paenibacillus cellulosilyticus]QKS45647.1 hypothetical protein HUB94_15290 [Paenibacillus cellulosilyticus]
MKLDLSLFKENLPAREEYLQSYTPGLFRAIEAAHTITTSANVDWDSFTVSEAKAALDMAMNYLDTETLDENDDVANNGNAIHEFLHSNYFVNAFRHLVPEKETDEITFI